MGGFFSREPVEGRKAILMLVLPGLVVAALFLLAFFLMTGSGDGGATTTTARIVSFVS